MELFRALGALAEPPSEATGRLTELLELGEPPARGEYEALFVFRLYPYASVYLGPEGQLGGEARDRIAGFWRALDLEPPSEPDHLALMLSLYARLADLESDADGEKSRSAWHHARRAWYWEHLAPWLPIYLDRLIEVASPFYRRWGKLLVQALADEGTELGAPDSLSLHLREAPPLGDPRESSGATFLAELLGPVRTGFILLASDLQQAAADLQIGTRAGERRYTLEALLGQDPPGTLGWLAKFAASRLEVSGLRTEPTIAEFWRTRARASSELLGALSKQAAESAVLETETDKPPVSS